MCCTRLAGNTGRKDDAKNRHLRTIAQLNNNKVYALPIVGLHALPNSPHIITAGLQARISKRSVYLAIV